MNFKNIKIATRVLLGFGLIVVLVVILGGVSYLQSRRLWQNTYDLYNHPLQVGRTVRGIQSNVLEISRIMKDLAMDENLNENQILEAVKNIDSYEKEIYKYFDLVNARYLGPRSTIDSAFEVFEMWKPVRDNLINVRKNSGRDAAFKVYTSANKDFVEGMIREIYKMIDFSTAKGDTFYQQAFLENSKLTTRLILLIIIILFSSGLVVYLLIRAVNIPLSSLTEAAFNYSLGHYEARCDYKSTNEFGNLASAFNNMAESVQNDLIIKENAAFVSQVLMKENELKPFCKELLNAILFKTESNIAAIYLLSHAKDKYEHFESIGLSSINIKSFSAKSAEGEFGALLLSRKITRISEIPEDTVFSFNVVAGVFKPREIISIPIIEGNEVVAVISLASLKKFSELSIRLIDEILVALTARIIGVISYQKITDFSNLLDKQNRALAEKSRELVMQTDELKEFNIELELQKKQLDESNKLKSAFLSNMSHELRTPLNSVIALSGVLERRLKGIIPADEYNYIGIIEKNGKNLLSLINDILDLSRIEAGKEEITFSQFYINELIEDITGSLDQIAREKDISISFFVSANMPPIISDRSKCHHIMQNLIGNAVKFTEKGSVTISASVNGNIMQVDVKDTGIGISEDFMPFVFDEFRQSDDKASRKFGGTGLGLAIVKKYCQMLDGSVKVQSQPGSGSAFTVELPMRPSENQVTDIQIKESTKAGLTSTISDTSGKTGKLRTVLLVEDSEPQIIQITDILKEEGYLVNVARNGREALDAIEVSIPEVMILDLQMPEVDGFEVLKQVRSLEVTRKIPVLILTAKHITKAELSFLKENHIYQLIQKGEVNRQDLLRFVKNLFNPQQKRISASAKTRFENSEKRGKGSILMIEDNFDSFITVKALLKDDYTVNYATDGTDGLNKASVITPDLILLDINLPGMDGYQVLDKIKRDSHLSGIPVIALTAKAMKGDREVILANGFDGYIPKPIDNETFEKTILEFLKLKLNR